MKQILLIMLGLSSLVYADYTRSNGVVTDSKTTLQWQDDYSDNGNSVKVATWTGAIDYCETLSLDGAAWRLPNKKELLSIVDYSRYDPSISIDINISIGFKNITSDYYWSATTNACDAFVAWGVDFYVGYTDYGDKTHNHNVRCVRTGQ